MDICPLDSGYAANGHSNGHIKDRAAKLNETLGSVTRIIAALDLALISTAYVANINFEILKKEYKSLKDFMEGEKCSFISEQKLISEFSKKPVLEPARKQIAKHENTAKNSANSAERKRKISEFLRAEGPKTINEITFIFHGISEKSVQRDLSELVKSGEIAAEGEKRWRRYSHIAAF